VQRLMDQIVGEIGWPQLDLSPVAFPSQRAFDNDVVFDSRRGEAEHTGSALQLGVEARFDHLFLARQLVERFVFAQTFHGLLARDGPVALAGPSGRRKGLWVALGNSDFVHIFAKPDIRGPAAEFRAARDVEDRQFLPPLQGRNMPCHPLHRVFNPCQTPGDRAMPLLIGAATLAVTLLSMASGQINTGFEAFGVLLAAVVLMTLREE
jgi:hypothetical protein